MTDADRATLERIATRLASPERWCAFHAAENAGGMEVPETDPRAVRWCLLGVVACELAPASYVGHPVVAALAAVARDAYPRLLIASRDGDLGALDALLDVNDGGGYLVVRELLATTLAEG